MSPPSRQAAAMPVHNEDVAAIFDEFADLLEIDEANPFRVRAYRNAARTVRGLGRELGAMIEQGEDLTRLPGIGRDLAAKIAEICASGRAAALEELHKKLPASLEQLLAIAGLGPKRVKVLYRELRIRDLRQLERAARAGHIAELPGFGAGLQQQILDAVVAHRSSEQRFLLNTARRYGEALSNALRAVPGVREVVVAGSYRRCKETVGDLDILVAASAAPPVMERLCGYDEVAQVAARGAKRATVVLRGGLQVDLRVVGRSSFGAALHYFTGSRAHNIQIRRLGQQRGLKINEYGVFKAGRRVAGATEASVFRSVGLPFVPPELREGADEIDAARARRLPALITRADLRGDLHTHSAASDGRAGIREMAQAARAAGLKYIAVTDHSRRLTVAHGLDESRLLAQHEEVQRLNAELRGFTVLHGVEVDILEDGALDLPDRVLERLDIVVGAVHSHFQLPRKRQTARILRAMEHRCFSLLAHPSGRLLGERAAYDVDLGRIIKQAAARGCFLELNAQPQRLDLTDTYCRMARAAGVLVSVNSDAHGPEDFAKLDYGIGQARRGWLEKSDVLNTRSLDELRRLLRCTMG